MDDIKRVETVLSDFNKEFRSNTFDFLYESDIKSRIFSKLYDSFKESIQAEAKYHSAKNYREEGLINTSRVKSEYPSRKLFDISILKQNNQIYTNELDPILLQNDIFWILPISIALQLKYLQLGDNPIRKVKDFLSDIFSLKAEIINGKLDYGYALFFIQSYDENILSKVSDIIETEDQIFYDSLSIHIISPHQILRINK